MATAIEDYMDQILSRHKMRESQVDDEYQNELIQNQAEESQALNEIMNEPFDMTARSYNMNPQEWIGREQEARQKIAAMVSNQYTAQRASVVGNKTQNKSQAMEGLMSTLQRLQSVNAKGVSAMDEYAPKDPSLRSQLVFNPETGTVEQQAKTLPDEDSVRVQELADYLQLPKEVVAKQRTAERVIQNDAKWKQLRRMTMQEKDLRAIDAAKTDADKAQWARSMQRAEAAEKYSQMSPQAVKALMDNPDTPEEIKGIAAIGGAVRQGIIGARRAKEGKERDAALNTIVNAILNDNLTFNDQRARGIIDENAIKLAIDTGKKQMKLQGRSFGIDDPDEYADDFFFANPGRTDMSLSDIEAMKAKQRQRDRFDIDENGNRVPAEVSDLERLLQLQQEVGSKERERANKEKYGDWDLERAKERYLRRTGREYDR